MWKITGISISECPTLPLRSVWVNNHAIDNTSLSSVNLEKKAKSMMRRVSLALSIVAFVPTYFAFYYTHSLSCKNMTTGTDPMRRAVTLADYIASRETKRLSLYQLWTQNALSFGSPSINELTFLVLLTAHLSSLRPSVPHSPSHWFGCQPLEHAAHCWIAYWRLGHRFSTFALEIRARGRLR